VVLSAAQDVIRGADLVLHTAGPFQRLERCAVLEAALELRIPYMDVADDTGYSMRFVGMQSIAY
jgi:saccharopine dehydrogenase-like NADP-dependent oxidoreductase